MCLGVYPIRNDALDGCAFFWEAHEINPCAQILLSVLFQGIGREHDERMTVLVCLLLIDILFLQIATE